MSDPLRETPRGRLQALGGLRGLAAFLVVLHHVELMLFPGSRGLLHGHFNVDFFLVRSGFVIAMPMNGRSSGACRSAAISRSGTGASIR